MRHNSFVSDEDFERLMIFSPTCTSYDYDAPINESGKPTQKFYAVRDLLARYLPESETLPEIPDTIPVISIPTIAMTEIAPVFDNLPLSKQSDDIRPMEMYDQGWGSILYRTTLPETCDESQSLLITEVHDWAQVYLNGKKLATLSRLKGEGIVKLPPVKKGDQLDILVEAMGRMNFGKGIYDPKGITEKVELQRENVKEVQRLQNWQVYNLPIDYNYVSNLNYRKGNDAQGMPAYYRATFTIAEVGDTFLSMLNWSKGMVWVNGHALGRYWEIGPQQTLYLPGCWLKEGENEIIVLDMAGPVKPETEGLRQPILDMQRGNGAYAHRKMGETLDLSQETPVYEGTFKEGNGWQHISFGREIPTRYFCLEALNAHDGGDYAAIAELELLGIDGKPVSRQHWKVLYADSEETDAANNVATNVFDKQESTYWHTNYSSLKPKFPHQIVIDLEEEKVITGFSYLPRAEAGKPGMIKDYKVYLQLNPFNF